MDVEKQRARWRRAAAKYRATGAHRVNQARYRTTAAGLLTEIRHQAKRRGNR